MTLRENTNDSLVERNARTRRHQLCSQFSFRCHGDKTHALQIRCLGNINKLQEKPVVFTLVIRNVQSAADLHVFQVETDAFIPRHH